VPNVFAIRLVVRIPVAATAIATFQHNFALPWLLLANP
jgi:hypothetical protein